MLRAELLRRRAATPPIDRARASLLIRSRILSLPEVRGATGVFAFISHGAEVHLRALIDVLDATGVRVAVPRVVGPGEMIAAEFPGWDDLAEGVLGIPAPASTEPARFPVEVVITPGLGFDPGGRRLGYGGGYYDRWLALHPAPIRVAAAFDFQVVDAVPVGEGDQPVDVIVTETRVIRTGSRGPAQPPEAVS
ncbi:MAG: 5-formyltetrahydrofolate cyclo-ligase [Gemmatimonadota bacterium]